MLRLATTLALAGAAIGALVTVVMWGANERFPVWYVVAIGTLAGLASSVLVPLLARPGLYAPPPHGAAGSPEPGEAPVDELERLVAGSTRRRSTYVQTLQPVLRDLVDDRLIRNIGADFATAATSDPDGIRRLVGDELWMWLADGDGEGRAPTMDELTVIVARVESL
jgi:hypothetical protein